jgi:nitrogen fixation protein
MNKKMIKILEIAVVVIGIGGTLLDVWIKKKQMDEKIIEKINEALYGR